MRTLLQGIDVHIESRVSNIDRVWIKNDASNYTTNIFINRRRRDLFMIKTAFILRILNKKLDEGAAYGTLDSMQIVLSLIEQEELLDDFDIQRILPQFIFLWNLMRVLVNPINNFNTPFD